MKKEIIVCIIILIFIIIGDIITQKYSKNFADEITKELQELETMIESNSEISTLTEKIDNIENKWNENYNKWAYFIEHEELEKVKTGIVSIKSYTKSEELGEAMNEVDKTIYILEHIVEKYKVNLKNIF